MNQPIANRMTPERLEQILDYRKQTREGNELPDVGYAHQCIDSLLDEVNRLTEANQYGRDIIEGMEMEARSSDQTIDDLRHRLDSALVAVPGVKLCWVEPSTTTSQPGYYTPLCYPTMTGFSYTESMLTAKPVGVVINNNGPTIVEMEPGLTLYLNTPLYAFNSDLPNGGTTPIAQKP